MAKPITPKEMRAWIKKTWDKCQQEAWQEQEPVGWADRFEFDKKGHDFWCNRQKPASGGVPLYAAPPHYWGNVTNAELVEELRRRDMLMVPVKEQEPVAWIMEMPPPSGADRSVRMTSCKEVTQDWENAIPLYTAPPKREWQGLTVEEARKFYGKYTDREELIYAIDKFLEEKNT